MDISYHQSGYSDVLPLFIYCSWHGQSGSCTKPFLISPEKNRIYLWPSYSKRFTTKWTLSFKYRYSFFASVSFSSVSSTQQEDRHKAIAIIQITFFIFQIYNFRMKKTIAKIILQRPCKPLQTSLLLNDGADERALK